MINVLFRSESELPLMSSRGQSAAIGSAGLGAVAYVQPSLGGASFPPADGGDYTTQSPRCLEEAPTAGSGRGLFRGARRLGRE